MDNCFTTDELRKLFLDFFRSKGHEIVASDLLVPKDDPTLLFTGAGMNQFKDKFLGRNLTYRRAASSQKCLRTGDLDNVGRTPRHHTFFEMLGNFSFGDYFKKEAICWAWEFFTVVLGIGKDRLWASIYKDDEEAFLIWKDVIKLPEGRIVRFGEKENFWPSEAPSKGPNGPCGPCSEIYFDYGADTGCGGVDCSPECECGRFVEVWNLVFTQFDRQSDGSLKPLPNKNIDTGMGLERLASVMQGVKNNFDIDIFLPLISEIDKYASYERRTKPVRRSFSEGENDERRKRVNAIADHIRAVVFTISDGVMPSNEGRGYVIRKLIRRATKHGQDIGIRDPFLYKLVSVVADVMKEAYPEVKAKRDDIAQVVKREEENFLVVLDTQMPKVEEVFSAIKDGRSKVSLAEAAFNFYDTYGMPYDMLEEIAETYGLKISSDEFEKLLDIQREQSRSKSKIKGEIFSQTLSKKVEALGLNTDFIGYKEFNSDAKVIKVLPDGEIILDRTPFYGESGGQVGDRGTIEASGSLFKVKDAKRIGHAIVHIGEMTKGRISEGDMVKVVIDESLRRKIRANHTATHLLHAALRKVLGEHVRQTGSLVDFNHLRFDFTHMKKMEPREVARVEELVNQNIKDAIQIKKEIKDIESAKAEGATALFGEKYDSQVRVVTIPEISKELCGGTHVDNTKDIGLFKIKSESSIASGVRRIEAYTGDAAREWIEKCKKNQEDRVRNEAQKNAAKKAMAGRLEDETAKIADFIARAKEISSLKLVMEIIDDVNMEVLRNLADRIRQKTSESAIILATVSDGKASFIVSIPDHAVSGGTAAGTIAKEMAVCLDGSGGGKPGFAQGGGKRPDQLTMALKRAEELLREKLK